MASVSRNHQDWVQVLDEFEAEMTHARTASPDDIVAPRPFQPPTHLGPLPESLRERAEALLRTLDETTAVVSQAITSARRSASVANQMGGRAPRPASSIDVSA